MWSYGTIKAKSYQLGTFSHWKGGKHQNYHQKLTNIDGRSHVDEKSSEIQTCKKCQPEVTLSSFQELLSHSRTMHRKINVDSETSNIQSTDFKLYFDTKSDPVMKFKVK